MAPDKMYIHRTFHLGLWAASEIPVDAHEEAEFIRKDVIEHIIKSALGPQDALYKIRSL